MHFDTPSGPDSMNTRLADALDRLAGVLEQQARGLEEVRAEVRALVEAMRQVGERIDGLERARAAAPAAPAAEEGRPRGVVKNVAKKRGK